MKKRIPLLRSLLPVLALFVTAWNPIILCGQAVPYARIFPKTKEEVEGLLKEIQGMPARTAIVDGFVASDQPLSDMNERFTGFLSSLC